MKAITLWQPWASLVVYGYKTVEYRTHDRFRHLVGSRVAIHAGMQDDPAIAKIRERYPQVDWQALLMPRGVVMGTAVVISVEPAQGVAQAGQPLFAYKLKDVERYEAFYPAKGRQGVWGWFPPEGAKKVKVSP
jgi:hypothetical protein